MGKRKARAQGLDFNPSEFRENNFSLILKSIQFTNEFLIHIYLKSFIKKDSIKKHLTLPNFFILYVSNLPYDLENLVAAQNSILAGSSYIAYDAKVNGRLTDIHLYRYTLITEGPFAYYVVEISFSPETGGSIQIWQDLKEMLSSFHVLK